MSAKYLIYPFSHNVDTWVYKTKNLTFASFAHLNWTTWNFCRRLEIHQIFRFPPWLIFYSESVMMCWSYFPVRAVCAGNRTWGQSTVWWYTQWNFSHKMKSVSIYLFLFYMGASISLHF